MDVAGITAYNAKHQSAGRPAAAPAGDRPTKPADLHAEFKSQMRLQPALRNHNNGQTQTSLQCQQDTKHIMRRLNRQPNAHLAALQAQGILESITHPLTSAGQVQNRHFFWHQQVHSLAAVQKPHKRPVSDMFGVAAADTTEGSGMGLFMMRPASSLW